MSAAAIWTWSGLQHTGIEPLAHADHLFVDGLLLSHEFRAGSIASLSLWDRSMQLFWKLDGDVNPCFPRLGNRRACESGVIRFLYRHALRRQCGTTERDSHSWFGDEHVFIIGDFTRELVEHNFAGNLSRLSWTQPTHSESCRDASAIFFILRLATPALRLGVLAGSWLRSAAFVLPFWSATLGSLRIAVWVCVVLQSYALRRYGYSFSSTSPTASS